MWSIKQVVQNSMSAFDAFENLFGKSVTTFAPAKKAVAPKKSVARKVAPKKSQKSSRPTIGAKKKPSKPKNIPGKFGVKAKSRKK